MEIQQKHGNNLDAASGANLWPNNWTSITPSSTKYHWVQYHMNHIFYFFMKNITWITWITKYNITWKRIVFYFPCWIHLPRTHHRGHDARLSKALAAGPSTREGLARPGRADGGRIFWPWKIWENRAWSMSQCFTSANFYLCWTLTQGMDGLLGGGLFFS